MQNQKFAYNQPQRKRVKKLNDEKQKLDEDELKKFDED